MSTEERWHILGIDSGSPDIGISIVEVTAAGAALRHAAHVEVVRPDDRPCPACKIKPCRHGVEPELVEALCDAAEETLAAWGFSPEIGMPRVVVAEQAQTFGGPERGNRSILLGLAVMAAMLDRARCWTKEVYQYTPTVWKGTTPKDQHQRVTLAQLSPHERTLIPRSPRKNYYVSDALDAAAIALWWAVRVGVRSVQYYCGPHVFEGQVEPSKSIKRSKKR